MRSTESLRHAGLLHKWVLIEFMRTMAMFRALWNFQTDSFNFSQFQVWGLFFLAMTCLTIITQAMSTVPQFRVANNFQGNISHITNPKLKMYATSGT